MKNKAFGCIYSLCIGAVALAQTVNAELAAENIPNVERLSAPYSENLLYVHDGDFESIVAGKVVLLDVAASSHNYKGALDAAQFPSFIASKRKDELYVAETFYSRGTRGERTDVLTIYDKYSLKPVAEIPLPGGKRGMTVTHRYTMQLIDDDKYLLLFNFTPAASIMLIDLQSREILNEVFIPGCSLAYPTGERGFSSLCGNGSMFSAQFDKKGRVTHQEKLQPFFSVAKDPLFDKPVYVGANAYFPSYKGQLYPVDLSGKTPQPKTPWSLLSAEEETANWRPGGWQIATVDDEGLIYVLMHKDGLDGSHKGGGSEVWVYEPSTQKRLKKITLRNWGVSVEVTGGKTQYLVVTNADMQLDVYKANSGEWLKMIGDVAAMPFSLHAIR